MIWFIIGIAIGVLNGLTLRWTVGRLRPETSLTGVPLVMLGFPLRLGLVAALLLVALQSGIAPCLLSFTGLWLARWLVVYVTLSPRPLSEWPRR
jgi:hypothetical protein